MRLIAATSIHLFLFTTLFGQVAERVSNKMGENPIIFLDSAKTDLFKLQLVNSLEISNVAILKPKKVRRILGKRGNDDAVYVTTIKSAKKTYWSFFRTKSEAYRQFIASPEADTLVEYVLNGEPVALNATAGYLLLVTEGNFKTLNLIENGHSSISQKRYIVVISAKQPKKLIKASKKKLLRHTT